MQNNTEPKTKIIEGTIIEALPNTLFKIKLKDESEILAYLSGKMRMHRIKVLIGDKVEIVIDGYGERGRISKRL